MTKIRNDAHDWKPMYDLPMGDLVYHWCAHCGVLRAVPKDGQPSMYYVPGLGAGPGHVEPTCMS